MRWGAVNGTPRFYSWVEVSSTPISVAAGSVVGAGTVVSIWIMVSVDVAGAGGSVGEGGAGGSVGEGGTGLLVGIGAEVLVAGGGLVGDGRMVGGGENAVFVGKGMGVSIIILVGGSTTGLLVGGVVRVGVRDGMAVAGFGVLLACDKLVGDTFVLVGGDVGDAGEAGSLSLWVAVVGAKVEGVIDGMKEVAVRDVTAAGVVTVGDGGVAGSSKSHIKPKPKTYKGMLVKITYLNIRRRRF